MADLEIPAVPLLLMDQVMEVRFMELGSNGELYAVLDNFTVQRWHVRGGIVPRDNFTARKPINAFVIRDNNINADYTHAFLAHERGKIKMLKHSNLGPNRAFSPHATLQTAGNRLLNMLSVARVNNTISCLCLSEDRGFIYAASTKGVIYVWWIGNDGNNDKLADRISGYNGEVQSLAAGPNAVFSGSSDGRVRMYKREPGAAGYEVRHREIGDNPIIGPVHIIATALTFEARAGDPTRGRLYAGCTDGRVRCWKDLRVDEIAAWPVVELMEHHNGEVTCVTLCSDRFVVSGSKDGRICVWRKGAGNGNHTMERVIVVGGLGGDGHDPINCIVTQKDTWTRLPQGVPERWILYIGSLDGIWTSNLRV